MKLFLLWIVYSWVNCNQATQMRCWLQIAWCSGKSPLSPTAGLGGTVAHSWALASGVGLTARENIRLPSWHHKTAVTGFPCPRVAPSSSAGVGWDARDAIGAARDVTGGARGAMGLVGLAAGGTFFSTHKCLPVQEAGKSLLRAGSCGRVTAHNEYCDTALPWARFFHFV